MDDRKLQILKKDALRASIRIVPEPDRKKNALNNCFVCSVRSHTVQEKTLSPKKLSMKTDLILLKYVEGHSNILEAKIKSSRVIFLGIFIKISHFDQNFGRNF